MEYIYAALLLHKVGQPVSEAALTKVISATGAAVDEAKVKTLVACLNGVDIASELANAQIAVASAPSAGAGGASAPKAEEKKEEKQEESAAGLASLFG